MDGLNVPEELYSKFHKLMPILCVDVVVQCGDGIVLIKRDRNPAKGEWWFSGGRVVKGENLEQAARRIVRRETGLKVQKCVLLGHGQTQFETDPFDHGLGTHTINFVFCAKMSEMDLFRLTLDGDHVDYKVFTPSEIYASECHPYIKRFVGMAESVFDKNI